MTSYLETNDGVSDIAGIIAKPPNAPVRLSKMEQLLEKLPHINDHLELVRKIGEGTFSSVYLARGRVNPKEKYAVKHLIPTSHPSKIVRELKCMFQLGGRDNIVEVLMCLHHRDCVIFVMPYHPHDRFSNYIKDLRVHEIQMYMRELLFAVRRVHAHGIIHRDIKPSNFLFNRKEKKFLLVDFGLAQSIAEDLKSENAENCNEKLETSSNKRKRDTSEESDDLQQVSKRPALQLLSNNVNVTKHSWEEASKSSSSVVLKKPIFSQSFSSLSPVDSKVNFVRVQNSQVKAVFAAPMPVEERCHCDGRPRVCNLCITRKGQNAPRAGTPGFRPPEVLLKYPNQTTAVDMWACGVIMLCLLSATYPFFRSPDDITALAEIITLFGSKEVKYLARKLGRNIVCSEETVPVDLRRVCLRLRSNLKRKPNEILTECTACKVEVLEGVGCICQGLETPYSADIHPPEAYDLLIRLLDIDMSSRITAEKALHHPYFSLDLETSFDGAPASTSP